MAVWLVTSDRLQLSRLSQIRFGWPIVLLFVVITGSMILPAIRWWWLLRIQGLYEPIGKIFKLTWSSYLTALLLPGAASGDVAKAFLILRGNSQARERAFSTVLADRFLGLFSLLVLGLASSCWLVTQSSPNNATIVMATTTAFSVMGLALGIGALVYPPSRHLLFRFAPAKWRESWNESFSLYVQGAPQLVGCFALSLTTAALTISAFIFAADALQERVSSANAFLVGPLVIVANCLPITPGGIGVAEAVSSELFATTGMEKGAEIMTLTRICIGVVSLAGIANLITVQPQIKKQSVATSSEVA